MCLANGNGNFQGWIRLVLTILAFASAMFWSVSEIRSAGLVLDARLSEKMTAVEWRLSNIEKRLDRNESRRDR